MNNKKLIELVSKLVELAKAIQVNPSLMSDKPTHIHPTFGKVKSLKSYKTDKGTSHTLEIMEGEHKGKWTNSLESNLKPI